MSAKKDNLGPINKNIVYVPNYTVNKYKVSYILPTDNKITCTAVNKNTSTSTNSAIAYVYDYNTPIKNIYNNTDNIDVKCTQNNMQFLGWARDKEAKQISTINATNDISMYPIFIDKVPVNIYLYNKLIATYSVDSNFNLNSNNTTLKSIIANGINQYHIENDYKLENKTESNPYKLYTDVDCTTLFTNKVISTPSSLFLKGDPYITFQLGNDSTLKFSDNTTAPKKIPLSELSNGSKTTPSVNVSNEHFEFNKWQRLNDSSSYPASLAANSQQLKNYNNYLPETYTATKKRKIYTVTFKDNDNNCVPTPYPRTMQVDSESTLTKDNNDEFNSMNCTKAGYTFNGWKEEFTTRSYCPAINLLIYIVAIIVIAIIVKYLSNGFSNSKFKRSILFSSSQQ